MKIMTDRELLEFAAKAAGINGNYVERSPVDGCHALSFGIGSMQQIVHLWNPLTDDGDALRLVVKLGIKTRPYTGLKNDYATAFSENTSRITVNHNGNPYAAIRLAIVRAAAEIGKSMP